MFSDFAVCLMFLFGGFLEKDMCGVFAAICCCDVLLRFRGLKRWLFGIFLGFRFFG